MRNPDSKATAATILLTIVSVAIVSRVYHLNLRGGLEHDQLAWAVENYYGGISQSYVSMRDTLLAWQREQQPWSYPPGYPSFLALLELLGVRSLYFIRFVQASIDALATIPLYFVLHRLHKSSTYAAAGCLIYAAAPWWSAGSTYLLAESMLPALVILLLTGMILVRDHAARNLSWLVLGLSATILPLLRSEMILIIIPLAVWALLTAPRSMRITAIACLVGGFIFPILLWALRNHLVHGQFMLTPNVKWYVAWSGLGQVANDFGYVADDENADRMLRAMGLSYHSPAAEAYWFKEYLNAWTHHPVHVIKTILKRFEMIVGGPETLGADSPRIVLLLYGAMAVFAPLAVVGLVRANRTADAFLIGWPTAYALASLGLLYVERRYVRYAGLTYLLVLPVLLMEGERLVRKRFTPRPQGSG